MKIYKMDFKEIEGLIKEMKVNAKKEFQEQFYVYDDGNCVGKNTDLTFNFMNKEYILEMQCYWETSHWYSYVLKNQNGERINKGMVRL